MGVDIYLNWDGKTEEEKALQITGYDVTAGEVGYLRGAYNGHIGLDAIKQLFDGVNWNYDWNVDLKILDKNLEKLKKGLFITMANKFRGGLNGAEQQSYIKFVELAKKLKGEGKNPKVHFSY